MGKIRTTNERHKRQAIFESRPQLKPAAVKNGVTNPVKTPLPAKSV